MQGLTCLIASRMVYIFGLTTCEPGSCVCGSIDCWVFKYLQGLSGYPPFYSCLDGKCSGPCCRRRLAARGGGANPRRSHFICGYSVRSFLVRGLSSARPSHDLCVSRHGSRGDSPGARGLGDAVIFLSTLQGDACFLGKQEVFPLEVFAFSLLCLTFSSTST